MLVTRGAVIPTQIQLLIVIDCICFFSRFKEIKTNYYDY